MKEKNSETRKDGKLKKIDILSIVMFFIAGGLILSSLFLKISTVIFFSITVNQLITLVGYLLLLIIFCYYFYYFSIKGNYIKGYVYLPIMMFLFQFISCGDNKNTFLNLIYLVVVIIVIALLGAATMKTQKGKKDDLLSAFKFSIAILTFCIAIGTFICVNLSLDEENEKIISKYFSTPILLLAIITIYCGFLEFKIYLEKNKMMEDGQTSNIVLSENSSSTEISLPKQEPALIKKISPKKKKKTTTPQTNANKVTLKEVRETFYHLRDFEISNLWQRSVFLTAFLVLLFTVYSYVVSGILKNECKSILVSSEICCGIGLAGLAFSIIWIMMAKGSKAWYEIYERRIGDIETESELGIPEEYRMGADMKPWNLDSKILSTNAGNYSVSRLNIVIGIILLLIWFFICTIHYIIAIMNYSGDTFHAVILTLLPVTFLVILITALCNFWAQSSSIQNPSE